jgi:hypothetical protein
MNYARLFLIFYTLLHYVTSNSFENVIFSCESARVPNNRGKFCDVVTWQAAIAYSTQNYSNYGGSSGSFSLDTQNNYAQYIYQSILSKTKQSSLPSCSSATTRYACTMAFPVCPQTSSTPASGCVCFSCCFLYLDSPL